MHVFIRKNRTVIKCHIILQTSCTYLIACYGIVHVFYFRLLTFFKIKFLKINRPGPPSDSQTVWIQIKTDILLVFIWVQTVCKRLLADYKIIHWHAKSYNRLIP